MSKKQIITDHILSNPDVEHTSTSLAAEAECTQMRARQVANELVDQGLVDVSEVQGSKKTPVKVYKAHT